MTLIDKTAFDVSKSPLEELTTKQREVLDLLIQHKTSKEISRILGISPHTVDQRINFARAKLRVDTRGEAAQLYRELRELWEGSVYQDSYLAPQAVPLHQTSTNDPERLLVEQHPIRSEVANLATEQRTRRIVPEFFDGRHGTVMRIGAIAGMTIVLIFVILGGLSIYASLSEMIAG